MDFFIVFSVNLFSMSSNFRTTCFTELEICVGQSYVNFKQNSHERNNEKNELNFVINYYKTGRIKPRKYIRSRETILFHFCTKQKKNTMAKNLGEKS